MLIKNFDTRKCSHSKNCSFVNNSLIFLLQDTTTILPAEILEKIMVLTMRSAKNKVQTHKSLRNVDMFWRIVAYSDQVKGFLPRIYFSCGDALPETKENGMILVNMKRITKVMRKFSGVVLSLKEIINDTKWYISWLELIPQAYGWFMISNIFWKRK